MSAKQTALQAYNEALGLLEPDDLFPALEQTYCIQNEKDVPKDRLTQGKWKEWIGNASKRERRAWVMDAYKLAAWLIEHKAEKKVGTDKKFTLTMPSGFEELSLVIVFIVGDDDRLDKDGILVSETNARVSNSPYPMLALGSILSAFSTKDGPTFDETVKGAWAVWSLYQEEYLEMHPDAKNPFGASVEAYVLRPPTIETASVSVVSDGKGKAIGSILPFAVSEFTRNTFSEIPIETATVDGVPVLTQITDAEESIRHALKERTRRLLISGQGGQASLEFPLERKLSENSFFGLLYGEFERRFGTVMARNMGYLAKIIYSANQPLIISEHEGGQLFARHKDGRYRTPKKSDIARFNDAALALRNFVFFINMETRSWRALASIESGKNGVYTLDKALWFDRKSYTLTGGLVFALKRNSRQNSHLPRIIEGIEYYLARAWRPKNKISELLLPKRDNTGPGRWVEKGWRQFLALIGENMMNSEATLSRIFRRHKDVLASEGYIYRAGGEAQDTVEFRIGHGSISFRATDKGVEAAKQAWKQDWETKSLNELLGNPFDYQQK